MKTKTEICVPIRNEEELQQAKEILLRNGEKLSKKLFYLSYNCNYDNLYLSKVSLDWCLGSSNKHIEIHLSELESVLKGESVQKQSLIEEQKAKELIEKFIDLLPYSNRVYETAKQFALICVENEQKALDKMALYLEIKSISLEKTKTEIQNYEP